MNRRTALGILPAVAWPEILEKAVAQCAANGGSRLENYKFAFFSKDEAELAGRLMEIIIPADQNSPGAREAHVVEFADLMLSTGSEDARKEWRNGLELFRIEVQKDTPASAVATAAQEEEHPSSALGRFFVVLKGMTVNGYYTSPVGIHEDLKYQGNEHLSAPPRCDHPEHQS